MAIIEVENLRKTYKYYEKEAGLKASWKGLFHRKKLYKEAVQGISFEVEEGEVVGFIGPNGAGKTTTLKMLSGILYPTGGSASILGYVPWKRENEFKRQFSLVMGQKNQLWWDLPASDSLILNKCIYQIDDYDYQKKVDELSELLNVRQLLNVQVRRLSLGERMKMEIIAALLHNPKVVLLDEPTIGLDIVSQKNLREFLKYYNKRFKTTILLTSHYMNDIENLCNRIIVINKGGIVYNGNLAEINNICNENKIIKLRFDTGISNTAIEPYGKVKEIDGYSFSIEVEKDTVNHIIKNIIDELSPADLSIESLPFEDVISLLYSQGGDTEQ